MPSTSQYKTETLRPFKAPITVYTYLLSYSHILWRVIDRSSRSILDVGIGNGMPVQLLRMRGRFEAIGVDLTLAYIEDCKRRGVHNDYALCDARYLPFRGGSVDVVLLSQVIEHLPKEAGITVLRQAEYIARNQVMVATPCGYMPRDAVDGNPYEKHLSGWTRDEFERMGYVTKSQGVRIFFGPQGVVHRKGWFAWFVRKALYLLDIFLEVVLFHIQVGKYYFVAAKKIEGRPEQHHVPSVHCRIEA
jgi:SAM-dependent methyltransferase